MLHKKKKKLLVTSGLTFLASTLIIVIPVSLTTNLRAKDPLFQVQNQAKLISAVSLKHDISKDSQDYFSLKNKIFNSDGSKKSDLNLSDFFDFYAQSSNSNFEIVNFNDDFQWKNFKLDITDIEPVDQEQSFKIYYRLLQNLDNNEIAKSDLHTATIAYNSTSDYSLSNFTSFAKAEFSKLRPYFISEFAKSTSREIAKLTRSEEFLTKVNSAKTAADASKILDQYFNFNEILTNLLSSKINKFTDDTDVLKDRYSLELIKEPVLKNAFISKTPLKNIYRLYFQTKFSGDFAKQIAKDSTSSAKFSFAVDLDFSGLFLDESLVNDIELSPFSEQDFTNFSDESSMNFESVTSWKFLNFLKNQVFSSATEKDKFYKNLLNQATNSPLLAKIKLKNYISQLKSFDLFSKIKLDFTVDSDLTKLAFENQKVGLKFFGNLLIKNEKDETIAKKPFVQNVSDFALILKNNPGLTEKIAATKFELKQNDAVKHEVSPIPKEEILKLVSTQNFERLKSLLENPRYYGVQFDEDKLKLLVQDYQLPPVQTLIDRSKWSFTYQEEVAGIVNILSSLFPNQQEMLRFYASLAKKDTFFIGKYLFDWLKGLKLIDQSTKWPENLDLHNFFQELKKIKIENKSGVNNNLIQADQKAKKDIWLVSINNNYWAEKDRMPYSFYLHPKLKNIIDLMDKNVDSSFNLDYYVEQIRAESKKIDEKDPTIQENSEKYRAPIKTLTDFIVAFYQNVYSNKTGLLSENLGANFDYRINFEIDPVLVKVDGTENSNNEEKVKLKYWYKVGPIDKNGQLISTIYQTEPKTLEITTNKDGKIVTDEVEALDKFAKNFRSATLSTYLDKQTYADFWSGIIRTVGTSSDYVDITKLIKKFPMWSYFTRHHPDFGLMVKKDEEKNTTQSPDSVSQTSQENLNGVFENVGLGDRKALYFYVYNKKNPKEFSTRKLKFFVYQTEKSLLVS
ncbi:P97 family adhesin [Mesomycoplasma dispar]|nr:hypothetical protein [Mesomycoplasma dispar]